MSFLIGPLVGGLVSGIFGGGAARPAAQAQTSAEQAQAALTNAMISAYTGTFLPAEQQALGQYQALAAGQPAGPMGDIVQSQIISDLLPQVMPQILQSRAQYGIQNQVDQTVNALQSELAKRGISGPAAEALLTNVRMQGLQGQAQLGSDIGAWEAQQTLASRGQAAKEALGLIQEPGTYAVQAGALPGQAGMTGAFDLAKLFGQQAQAAADPWRTMGQNISQAAAQYYATPRQPTGTSTTGVTGGGGYGLPAPMPPVDTSTAYPTTYPGTNIGASGYFE